MLTLYFNVSSKRFVRKILTCAIIDNIRNINACGANYFKVCVRFVTSVYTKAPFKLKNQFYGVFFISSVKLKGRMKIE